ncbi:MAG: hypothetical protein Q8N51_12890 [Gammaproteobacteria bacterium]|nr:hypothetical protein [Gammaproteobacteria bacterium]
METIYRHTQIGHVILGALGVPALVAVAWLLRAAHPVAVAMLAFFGCLLVLFSTLTVVVRDQVLDVSFGPGLIRRRIPLRNIREVRVVSNPWYYGWGIRLTSGWSSPGPLRGPARSAAALGARKGVGRNEREPGSRNVPIEAVARCAFCVAGLPGA